MRHTTITTYTQQFVNKLSVLHVAVLTCDYFLTPETY